MYDSRSDGSMEDRSVPFETRWRQLPPCSRIFFFSCFFERSQTWQGHLSTHHFSLTTNSIEFCVWPIFNPGTASLCHPAFEPPIFQLPFANIDRRFIHVTFLISEHQGLKDSDCACIYIWVDSPTFSYKVFNFFLLIYRMLHMCHLLG